MYCNWHIFPSFCTSFFFYLSLNNVNTLHGKVNPSNSQAAFISRSEHVVRIAAKLVTEEAFKPQFWFN